MPPHTRSIPYPGNLEVLYKTHISASPAFRLAFMTNDTPVSISLWVSCFRSFWSLTLILHVVAYVRTHRHLLVISSHLLTQCSFMHQTTHTFQEYSVVCRILYCYRGEGASCPRQRSGFGTELPLRRPIISIWSMIMQECEEDENVKIQGSTAGIYM